MLGYVCVVDTPYFALTDDQGRIRIESVPPGEYSVRVWHEHAGRLTKEHGPMEITVTANGPNVLEYKVKAPAP
jgi:hypothetical protein